MRRRTLAGLLLAAGLGWGAPAASTNAIRIAHAGDGGLVMLGDGTVLAWNTKADIQLRQRDGKWSPVQHLSASFLEAANPGNGVFHVLGETVDPVARFLTSKAFSIRRDGAVAPMAGLPDDVTAIVYDGDATWLATPKRLFRLEADGKLGSSPGANGGSLLVARRGGSRSAVRPAIHPRRTINRPRAHPIRPPGMSRARGHSRRSPAAAHCWSPGNPSS